MVKFTRRDFIRYFASGLGGLTLQQFLIACSRQQIPIDPTPTQAPISTQTSISPTRPASTETPLPAGTGSALGTRSAPTWTASPAPFPDLVVARSGEPEDLVRQALAALGGIERFVPSGANVVIKPNICVGYHTYEYAATTNPWVVGTLVQLCREAGAARVQVMDAPFGGTAKEAYSRTGIAEQVQVAGGEMVQMPGFKYLSVDIPAGLDLHKCDIFDEILNADVVINVPVAKHHNLARLTLGMKNLMGVIRDRQGMHKNIGQRLADLTSRIPPTLTVVDAVRILTAHGPSGGSLDDVQKLDTVIASPDIVAADSYAASLFGLKPDDLDYIRAGTAMNLGRSDLENLHIEEITVSA